MINISNATKIGKKSHTVQVAVTKIGIGKVLQILLSWIVDCPKWNTFLASY